jgi:hypothetical protein
MKAFDISYTTIKDTAMTLIYLGEGAGDLPRHLMVGERECGYIVRDESITPWYWDNIIDRNGDRYLACKELHLLPFSKLFSELRPHALALLQDLAKALKKVPAGFVHPTNGYIETWRIFFLEGGGFLLLPISLSNIISATISDEERFDGYGKWVKPQVEYPFGLCHQFTQFLYTACTGFAPFAEPSVRNDQWRHVPLSLGFTDASTELAKWVDDTLAMQPKEQRLIASPAYSGEENLDWWLNNTENFRLQLSDGPKDTTLALATNPATALFLQQQQRRADQRVFWRKKGALVTTLGIAGIIVLALIVNIVVKELQPPYTKGMEPTQIIMEYYNAQNELDTQKMTASFVRGLKNPAEMEVSGLFVNSRIRLAYEGKETILRADQWLEQGMPAVPDYVMIYGIADLDIKQLDADRYLASFRYFGPSYDESMEEDLDALGSDGVESPGLLVSEILMATEFTFTDTKGYWQISAIKVVSSVPVATMVVQTYTEAPAGNQIQDGLIK